MRGLAIFIVVMYHSYAVFSGIEPGGFSICTFLVSFSMPLFFFISGFVLYKKDVEWTSKEIIRFVKNKSLPTIISPCIFLFVICLVSGTSFVHSLGEDMKRGYWFTLTLFEYYIFYIILAKTSKALRLKGYAEDIFLLSCSALLFFIIRNDDITATLNGSKLLSAIGTQTWLFFFYLILGTRIRKYYNCFEELMKSKYFTLCCVATFITSSMAFYAYDIRHLALEFVNVVSGTIVILCLFRKHQDTLSSQTRTGRAAIYLGQHTLDIYFIHYFFFLNASEFLKPLYLYTQSSVVELFVSIAVATCIILCSLGVSSVLSLNSALAHILFGTKVKTSKQEH